jgi:predicted ATP-dependent serine protease
MKACTKCRVKFEGIYKSRCPKCRSYECVREISSTTTGSSSSYETVVGFDFDAWALVADYCDSSSSNYDSGSSSYDSDSSSYNSCSYDSGSSSSDW